MRIGGGVGGGRGWIQEMGSMSDRRLMIMQSVCTVVGESRGCKSKGNTEAAEYEKDRVEVG